LDVPAGFGGEWCSSGARKIHYVKNIQFPVKIKNAGENRRHFTH